MSQTGVIDLSVINKNLSIRFRWKFRKQSEGSISNYLRAIPFARTCFQLSNGNTRMIAWVIAKTVKGEGLIYSEEFFILTTLIIWVIRKCGLCDNFDPSCDQVGGGPVMISQAEIECRHIGRDPSITTMGGQRAACNWVNQLEDANPRWAGAGYLTKKRKNTNTNTKAMTVTKKQTQTDTKWQVNPLYKMIYILYILEQLFKFNLE